MAVCKKYNAIAVSTLLFETTHPMQVLRSNSFLLAQYLEHHLRIRAAIAVEKTPLTISPGLYTTCDKPFATPCENVPLDPPSALEQICKAPLNHICNQYKFVQYMNYIFVPYTENRCQSDADQICGHIYCTEPYL